MEQYLLHLASERAEAEQLETESNDVAEYQASAYQRGRKDTLDAVLADLAAHPEWSANIVLK